MAALVLSLLIATANSSFEAQSGHIRHIAADLIMLDQLLAQYGPEVNPVRVQLRQAVGPLIERIWDENQSASPNRSPFEASSSGQNVVSRIVQLDAQSEAQRIIKDRAIQVSVDLVQTRLTLFEQAGSGISLPFLTVLIFWLSIIFASFGMFSRLNPVSVAAIVLFAVSASGALFLILELSQPFSGMMRISSAPLNNALAPL